MGKKVCKINQLDDLYKIIDVFATTFTRGVIYLEGDLGVGKTTFAQRWMRICGVSDVITSPSYQIIKEYLSQDDRRFLHADLYRLADPEELIYLDVRDWRENAEIIFIEWPSKGRGYLPDADVRASFYFAENGDRFLSWEMD